MCWSFLLTDKRTVFVRYQPLNGSTVELNNIDCAFNNINDLEVFLNENNIEYFSKIEEIENIDNLNKTLKKKNYKKNNFLQLKMINTLL